MTSLRHKSSATGPSGATSRVPKLPAEAGNPATLAADPHAALCAIDSLIEHALACERDTRSEIDAVHERWTESARNLAHYIGLRQHDLRALQGQLARLGLSSLGRMEAHVMATLTAVRAALHALTAPSASLRRGDARQYLHEPLSVSAAQELIADNAHRALGPAPEARDTRIMVTLPENAAGGHELIAELAANGMDVARINCAHGDPEDWIAQARQVRAESLRAGHPCRVSFDLAGPKMRTGPIQPGIAVRKFKPVRDEAGRVLEPASLILAVDGEIASKLDDSVPVAGKIIHKARPGDQIVLHDLRGKKRVLIVTSTVDGACRCTSDRTIYLGSELRLTLRRQAKAIATGRIGRLAALPGVIMLSDGDLLEVFLGAGEGTPARIDPHSGMLEPARIGCDLPAIFAAAQPNACMLFDDGRITARVLDCAPDRMRVRIETPGLIRAKLRAEKGINMPGTTLALPALTEADRDHLKAIAGVADAVALSFVQSPTDVQMLLDELQRIGATHLCVILKIETRAAFNALPRLLYAAMRHPSVAVMVARGDLASEVGFERLSELQEEILWFCEAAHVPVIWATQVLESFTKNGRPSRAEVTDAAMSGRAECVMLNKGPFAADAVQFLAEVLARMQTHQSKKTALLRRLSVSGAPAVEPRQH